MLPSDAGQIATVLVALAILESRPSQMSAGKETRVPPPATELITPARKAAPKATTPCQRWNGEVKFEDSAAGGGHKTRLGRKWSEVRAGLPRLARPGNHLFA